MSSLTSSPDSSPSPIAVALGQAGLGGMVSNPSVNTTPQSQAHTSTNPSPQHQQQDKLWTSTPTPAPTSAAGKVSPMIRDFVQSVDDREWQNSLYSLLQNQTYNQCEVDLFELMCKVLDQNLFSQVDWARNSVFFKDLKVSRVHFYIWVSGLTRIEHMQGSLR